MGTLWSYIIYRWQNEHIALLKKWGGGDNLGRLLIIPFKEKKPILYRKLVVLAALFVFNSCAYANELQAPRINIGLIDFKQIDQHALAVPRSKEKHLNSLVAYLIRPAKGDLQKARAIFRWITQNIAYDADAYFSGNYRNKKATAEMVLRQRRGVCDAYATLFNQMAVVAGLEVRRVSGVVKGIAYELSQSNRQDNHVWNTVKIAGSWYLLDATWGSGTIDSKSKIFKRQFRDYYFFPSPEELIYSHFPKNASWQLINTPTSFSTFHHTVVVKPGFFRHGLKLISHTQGVIDVTDELKITLRVPATLFLTAKLTQSDGPLPKNLIFVQRQYGVYQINVLFPQAGEYWLHLYIKDKANAPATEVITYKVLAQSGVGEQVRYPEYFLKYEQYAARLFSPLRAHLEDGKNEFFKIQVPGAFSVAIIAGQEWFILTKSGEMFSGLVRVRRGAIQVMARFTRDSRSYNKLLQYTGSF